MNIIFFPNALAHLSNSLNTLHTSDSTSSSSSSSSLSSSNSLSPLASSPINSVRTLSSVSSPALSAWSLSGLSNMGNSIATPAATSLIPAASGSFSAQLWRQTSNATTLSESSSLKSPSSSSSSSSSFGEVRSAGSSASSSSSASISKRIEIYDNGQLLYEFVSPKVVRNILSTIDGGVSLRQRGGKLLLLGDDVIAAAGQYEIQRKASYVHANYPHIHTPFQTMDEWQLRQSQQNKFNFRFR